MRRLSDGFAVHGCQVHQWHLRRSGAHLTRCEARARWRPQHCKTQDEPRSTAAPLDEHLTATGDAAADAIDADAALQTVSDARWAPILQEIRGKAGGPGAVAALRRAVATYGAAPDAAYASCFPFELDEYQIEALRHLRNDSNVIVSAPTKREDGRW